MPAFSLVVLVQQDPAILDLFLHSLSATLVTDCQIVIVEDGNQPNVRPLLDKFQSTARPGIEVQLLQNETPRGYAVSANQALRLVTGEIVVMADSDIIFLPGWQGQFADTFAKHPNAAVIGTKLIYPQSGGIQHCGIAFSEDVARHLWLNAPANAVSGQPFAVQSVVFALCAIRRAVLENCELLDENFFNGYEDLDYCLRLRKAGFEVLVAPEITAYHWERSSGLHREFNRRRNLGRLWSRWGAHIEADLWDFFSDGLKRAAGAEILTTSSEWVGVDLCEDRVDSANLWSCVTKTLGAHLKSVRDFSFRIGSNEEIWLPRILGSDSHLEPYRYIFAVQNIARLTANSYWWQLRSALRDDDLVVDLYANVYPLNTLMPGAWPGNKIR